MNIRQLSRKSQNTLSKMNSSFLHHILTNHKTSAKTTTRYALLFKCHYFMNYFFNLSDLYCLGKLTFTQGWNANRKHRRGLPQWPQAHAFARGHFRRNPSEAG